MRLITYRLFQPLFRSVSNKQWCGILSISIFILSACGGKDKANNTSDDTIDSTKHRLTDTIAFAKGYPLILSDSSWSDRYHKDFFKGYKNSKFSRVELIDNYIILDQKDTTEFPGIPELGKRKNLKALAREMTVKLSFVRINYTTITYTLEFSHPRKKSLKTAGVAHLHPDFFLRMERDRSTTSGATYPVAEFEDQQQKKCSVKIRIGHEEISGSGIQATVSRNCNGVYGNISPENFPTLTETY